MGTSFLEERRLLLIEWRKAGIEGDPSEAEVILFAERRYNEAYRAWVEKQK